MQILDSGAGISGVGQHWKITNIQQADEVTVQGAFGDPMKPSIQGLLGPDKLKAVLVPGMKDDIYSLCQLLQPNPISGTNGRIAVFTENGAIIMTSESCKSHIERAIRQGNQTHAADQIGDIYILRQQSSTIASLSTTIPTPFKNIAMQRSQLDDLYTGYTQHGLNWLQDNLQPSDRTCHKTVYSDGLFCEDQDRRTTVACTQACNHPTRNNESTDLRVPSRARIHTSFTFRSEQQHHSINAVSIRPKSLYEDVHASTGHPGYTGMQWHQKNTIGANYTDKDAAAPRGIC